MKQNVRLTILALLMSTLFGCSPDEKTHASIVGGHLRSLYKEWVNHGRPANFEPTNYIFVRSSTYGTSNQYFVFTNTVKTEGVVFHCRFAYRDATRFQAPGVMAIADEEVILWIGDDKKIVVAPETKDWSSK